MFSRFTRGGSGSGKPGERTPPAARSDAAEVALTEMFNLAKREVNELHSATPVSGTGRVSPVLFARVNKLKRLLLNIATAVEELSQVDTKQAWSFQLQDMNEEVNALVESILGANTVPAPEPSVATPEPSEEGGGGLFAGMATAQGSTGMSLFDGLQMNASPAPATAVNAITPEVGEESDVGAKGVTEVGSTPLDESLFCEQEPELETQTENGGLDGGEANSTPDSKETLLSGSMAPEMDADSLTNLKTGGDKAAPPSPAKNISPAEVKASIPSAATTKSTPGGGSRPTPGTRKKKKTVRVGYARTAEGEEEVTPPLTTPDPPASSSSSQTAASMTAEGGVGGGLDLNILYSGTPTTEVKDVSAALAAMQTEATPPDPSNEPEEEEKRENVGKGEMIDGGKHEEEASSDDQDAVGVQDTVPDAADVASLQSIEAKVEDVTSMVENGDKEGEEEEEDPEYMDDKSLPAEERLRMILSSTQRSSAVAESRIAAARNAEKAALRHRSRIVRHLEETKEEISQLEETQAKAVEEEDFELAETLGNKIIGLQEGANGATTQLSDAEEDRLRSVELRTNALIDISKARELVRIRLAEFSETLMDESSSLREGYETKRKEAEENLASELEEIEQAAGKAKAMLKVVEEQENELRGKILETTGPIEEERGTVMTVLSSLEEEEAALVLALAQKREELESKRSELSNIDGKIAEMTSRYDRYKKKKKKKRRKRRRGGGRRRRRRRRRRAEMTSRYNRRRQAIAEDRKEAELALECVEERKKEAEEGVASIKEEEEEVLDKIREMQQQAEEAGGRTKGKEETLLVDDITSSQKEFAILQKLRSLTDESQSQSEALVSMLNQVTAAREEHAAAEEEVFRLEKEVSTTTRDIEAASRKLPELEGSKRKAASAKNFKEAAKLNAEIKHLTAEKDDMVASKEKVEGRLHSSKENAIEVEAKVMSLEDELVGQKREEGMARWRVSRLRATLAQLCESRAAVEEAFEEAECFQKEMAMAEEEVRELEREYGFNDDED